MDQVSHSACTDKFPGNFQSLTAEMYFFSQITGGLRSIYQVPGIVESTVLKSIWFVPGVGQRKSENEHKGKRNNVTYVRV